MMNTVEQIDTKLDDAVLDAVQGGRARSHGPQPQAPEAAPGIVEVNYSYTGGSSGGKTWGSGGGTVTLSNGSTVRI